MASPRLALFLAKLRYATRRLGWVGLAGVALAAGALGVRATAVAALEAEAEGVRSRLAVLRPQPAAPAASGPARQLETLRSFFPGRQAREAVIDRIESLAREHGLTLESGDYREIVPEAVRSGGPRPGELVRYQLTLPVKGSYPAWRAWLAALMNELPAVALDDFSLKRDAAASPVVDARVRFSLYFQER